MTTEERVTKLEVLYGETREGIRELKATLGEIAKVAQRGQRRPVVRVQDGSVPDRRNRRRQADVGRIRRQTSMTDTIDRDVFFPIVCAGPFGGSMTQGRVDGCNASRLQPSA
jgi:hypothetical protein